MTFKFKTSPEARKRIRSISREMDRLYALPDRWLAEEILRLCRKARQEDPRLADPRVGSYDGGLVWHLGPEFARRLGAKSLLPNEAINPEIVTADHVTLRCKAGSYLANSGLALSAQGIRGDRDHVSAHDMLGHEFVNGNPIAMAADRIAEPAPKGEDDRDWLARHMREVSRSRFGHEAYAAWLPDFSSYPRVVDWPLEENNDDAFEASLE